MLNVPAWRRRGRAFNIKHSTFNIPRSPTNVRLPPCRPIHPLQLLLLLLLHAPQQRLGVGIALLLLLLLRFRLRLLLLRRLHAVAAPIAAFALLLHRLAAQRDLEVAFGG